MTIQSSWPATMTDGSETAPARVVALSDMRAALFFDFDSGILPARTRLVALTDGAPFDGPVAVTRLLREDGGQRCVLIVEKSASSLCSASIRIDAADTPIARIDPLALQSPLVDPLALMAGLSEDGALRLLRMLLTTGASLFGKGDLGGFGMLVGQLVETLAETIPLAAWCKVGSGATVSSWQIPAGITLPRLRDVCILHNGRARRFTDFTASSEEVGGAHLVHILFDKPIPQGAEIIVLGDRPIRLCGAADQAPRSLAGWIERRTPATRAATLRWIDKLAGGDDHVAALREELTVSAPNEARIHAPHLSVTRAGLLYILPLDDPRGLVSGVRVESSDDTVEIACDDQVWHEEHGASLAGFAETTGLGHGPIRVAPVFRSGRLGKAVDVCPKVFDGNVPPVFHGLPTEVAARILARALPSAMMARPVWRKRVRSFGECPATPKTTLLIAAGEAGEHLNAALCTLAAEPRSDRTEVIIHHADGPATASINRTAEMLSAVHDIGIRIVSLAAESFPSERLHTALAEARAPRIIALGAGCLPGERGWLARWRRRIGAAADPRIVMASTSLCDGTPCTPGETVGLNTSAAAQLISSRARLPGIPADLAGVPGVRIVFGDPPVTAFEQDDADTLLRATERYAQENLVESADG